MSERGREGERGGGGFVLVFPLFADARGSGIAYSTSVSCAQTRLGKGGGRGGRRRRDVALCGFFACSRDEVKLDPLNAIMLGTNMGRKV